jgi:transposase InsO family protein
MVGRLLARGDLSIVDTPGTNAIFEYIEIFHNRCRRHSSLGMRTPIEYESLNQTQTPAS